MLPVAESPADYRAVGVGNRLCCLVRIGMPEDESPAGQQTVAGWLVPVGWVFTPDNRKAVYAYDFGDGWEHAVLLEKAVPRRLCCHGMK